MAEHSSPLNLFEEAQQFFANFVAELQAYGIQVNPTLELRKSDGIMCYYDKAEGLIYLSLPDAGTALGKLQLLLMRSLLGCDSNDEMTAFLKLFIPWMISHETAHHLRQRYGLFGQDLWLEEQIANQLAIAVVRRRFSLAERTGAQQFMMRAMRGLASQVQASAEDAAVDSYYDLLHALDISGQIDHNTFYNTHLMQKLFFIDTDQLLKSSGQISQAVLERLKRRSAIIEAINQQYASDLIQYLYYHLGWLYLDLTSRESHYIDEFRRLHLYQEGEGEILPLIQETSTVADDAILACYQAYLAVQPFSSTAATYFYRRYRSTLLSRLKDVELNTPMQTRQLRDQSVLLREGWNQHGPDMLQYLVDLVPTELKRLFPQELMRNRPAMADPGEHLPAAADRRLWRHVMRESNDLGAANTLDRLELMGKIEIYRSLPAETMIALAHDLCHLRLAKGEVLIDQGDSNNDIFILGSGTLGVIVHQSGGADGPESERHVNTIRPGEITGEITFLTDQPRSATVYAIEDCECFVVKASDLYIQCHEHPSILLKMATAVAQRLVQNLGTL